MALSLGLKRRNDVIIDNGKCRMIVQDIHPDRVEITVSRKGSKGIIPFTVTDEESVEIYPNVKISLGNTGDADIARLLFEAPRSIKIVRGFIYREEMKLYARQMGLDTGDDTGSKNTIM